MKYLLTEEDGVFVAQCLDVDVCTDGKTADEAIANLQEALVLYFDHELKEER